jgi:hypothetical protein
MQFDVISAIGITVGAAIVTATLAFALSRSIVGRLRAVAVVGAWFAVVGMLGATGALSAQGIGVAGLGAAVILPATLLCWMWLAAGPMREAMSAVPVPTLIAVNALRILGITFVLLFAAQRLPAPFAPAAGWGDVLIGITAGPVAWILARRGTGARSLALAWNALGMLDLLVAVALGATSSPGPARLFMDPPGSAIMTTPPWILIPCFIVPVLIALHVAIFDRLARTEEAGSLAYRLERSSTHAVN